MKQTKHDFLFGFEAPFVSIEIAELESRSWIPSFFYTRTDLDVCVRSLRGHKMRTVTGLMNEFAAAFQFFDGFGENWHALEDCLKDLGESLPADAYVLVIEKAEQLLMDEPVAELEALFLTLGNVGGWWSEPVIGNGRFDRGPKPFHVLMKLSDGASANFAFPQGSSAVAIREVGVPLGTSE